MGPYGKIPPWVRGQSGVVPERGSYKEHDHQGRPAKDHQNGTPAEVGQWERTAFRDASSAVIHVSRGHQKSYPKALVSRPAPWRPYFNVPSLCRRNSRVRWKCRFPRRRESVRQTALDWFSSEQDQPFGASMVRETIRAPSGAENSAIALPRGADPDTAKSMVRGVLLDLQSLATSTDAVTDAPLAERCFGPGLLDGTGDGLAAGADGGCVTTRGTVPDAGGSSGSGTGASAGTFAGCSTGSCSMGAVSSAVGATGTGAVSGGAGAGASVGGPIVTPLGAAAVWKGC